MAEKSSVIKLAALAAALGVAFWIGRASSTGHANEDGASRPTTRSTTRAPQRQAPIVSLPGAGQGAITSAADLRGIFKRSGANLQRGTSEAKLALAAMNGPELERLVHDLASTQAASPGYSYRLEIETACSRWAQVDPGAALAFALSNKQQSFRASALTSVFAGMAELDPLYAKQMLGKIQDPSLRRTLKYSIISSMAVTQPDAWLEEVKANPSMAGNIVSAISEWAVDDPVATASRIGQLPKSIQASAIATLATIWAGQDKQSAMNWANSLSNSTDRERALGSVAAGIAAKEPDAAIAMLSGLEAAGRRAGIASVFRTLIDHDFDGAMNRALAMTDEVDQATAIKTLIGSQSMPFGNYSYLPSAGSNAEQVHKLISRLPEGALRTEALSSLAQRMAHYSFTETENMLAGYTEKERLSMKLKMISSISYSSPTRALEMYNSLPEDDQAEGTLSNIINYLARNDPEAALNLALQKADSNATNNSVATALSYLSANDPAAALRRLESLPDGKLRRSAISSIAASWSQRDPESAMAWAEKLEHGERVVAMSDVLSNLATHDPKKAATTLSGLLEESTEKNDLSLLNNASRNLMFKWGKSDPESAAAWASKLPNSQSQSYAISSLAAQWVSTDIERASQWIESLPDGSARDAGAVCVVQATQKKDPATAFAWANSLSDQQVRYGQISYMLREWNKTNPQKARAAAMRADVTDSQRESILRNLQK